jgi:transcriptional regulator with XRE-family HTH domain
MQRLGTEARTARLALGWAQAAAARRAQVSQASVSRLEAGDTTLSISIITRAFAALGMKLVLSAYPADGVPLRDSGQLALAKAIAAIAHPSWRTLLEAPTGEGRQAADVLLLGSSGAIHLELESALVDFHAQLRKGELKRDALQARHRMPIALVLAVRDTERNRARAQPHLFVIRQALPAGRGRSWVQCVEEPCFTAMGCLDPGATATSHSHLNLRRRGEAVSRPVIRTGMGGGETALCVPADSEVNSGRGAALGFRSRWGARRSSFRRTAR